LTEINKKKYFSKIIFTVGIFCKILDESSVIYRNTTNTEQRKVHVDDIDEILLMDEKEINEQYKGVKMDASIAD
jgi:hypothetical protein